MDTSGKGQPARPLRVLLADDHELVRNGLRFYLSRLGPSVEIIEAAGYDEAAEAAGRNLPLDLVILDLRMPGMNGMSGVDRMLRLVGETPVVVLSGSLDQADVLAALQQGAAGYLPKTLSGQSMLNALQLVLAGETYVPAILLSGDGPSGRIAGGQAGEGPLLAKLTPREREALAQLVEGRSNKEIARVLQIQEITVKVHMSNLFRKLGATNRTQAVTIALNQGWRNG